VSIEVLQCFTILVKCSMADVLHKTCVGRWCQFLLLEAICFSDVICTRLSSLLGNPTTGPGYLSAKFKIPSFTRFPSDHHDLIRAGENLPRDHQVGPSNAWRVSREVVSEMSGKCSKHSKSRRISDSPKDCGEQLSKISEDSQATPATKHMS
jgi:hypothetical protein